MSRIKSRIFAFILTFCMMATGLYTQDMGKVMAAGEGSGTLTNCTIKIGNPPVPLTNETVIKNGDSLEIEFNWSLDNNDQTSTEFVVDLGTIKGLQITTGTMENDLKQGSDVVGKYYIADNNLHIVLDENNKFFGENERTGGVRVNGVVQVNDEDLQEGNKTPVGVGQYTVYPTVDDNVLPQDTWVNVSKGLSGGIKVENGQMYQTFTANIVAYNGDATNVVLTDTPGSGMSFPDNTQITVSGDGVDGLAGTYNGMAALNSALSGKTLKKNQSITLTYTLPVNDTVYQPNAGYDVKKNTLTVQYKNTKNEDVSNSASTEIQVTGVPSVSKAGELQQDNTVKWTITVNLGKYYREGQSLADVLSYIKDTPGSGLSGVAGNLDLSKFSHKENDIYTYEYVTGIDSSLLNSSANIALKNTVEMELKDLPGYKYTTVGTVDLPGDPWVTKTARTAPDENGYIVWDVVITPPQGVTNVVLRDTLLNSHEQFFVEGIYVNGILVRNVVGELYDGRGTYTADAKNILVQSNGTALNGGEPCYNIDLYFKDEFIAQNTGRPITITYKTKIHNELQTVFTNQARVDYVCPVIGSTSHTSPEAVYVDNTSKLALEKYAADIRNNSAEYQIGVDLTKYKELAVGDVIVVKDTLPKGMTIDLATCHTHAGYGLNAFYEDAALSVATPEMVDGKQVVTFSVTVDAQLLQVFTNNSGKPMLTIAYRAGITDKSELQALYEAGRKTYTNNAVATVGNLTATASAPVELVAPPVVDKSGTYDVNTAPDCKYVIEINKECLDLVDGNTLMGIDTLGDLVTYRNGSVEVQKNTSSGWVTMTPGVDYFFTYSEKNGQKNLTFTGLPDGTHLKISYVARLELIQGDFKNGEAGNKFVLQGSKNGEASEAYTMVTTAVQSLGWADSEFYSITLNKYWTDGYGQMHPLNGAEFKVVKMKLNESTGLLEEDSVLHDNIKVQASGETIIGGLTVQNIYALYETKAPVGYVAKTEPYYFVLQKTSVDLSKVDSSYTIHRFTNGSNIWYDNEPATGSLEIQKTVEGIETADFDASKISFTISPKVGNKDTYALSEFTKGNDGVYRMTFANVPVAEYTITENRTDFTGYEFETMDYSVKVGTDNPNTGTELPGSSFNGVPASVVKDTATTVSLTNSYTKDVITVSGAKTWDLANEPSATLPNIITVHLLADGLILATKEVTASDNWSWTFTNLPEYENGHKIVYSISETAIENYTTIINGYDITNKYTPNETSVSVSKVWKDNDNQDGVRPTSILVQLYADGVASGSAVTLSSQGQWSHTWTELPVYSNASTKIVYTVKEVNGNGEESAPAGYTAAVTGSASTGFIITNTHTPTKISVPVTKVWSDGENQDGIRPASVTVRLYADGVEINSATLSETAGWAYTFTGLPQYKNGVEIKYTISEDRVAGYTTAVSGTVAGGFTITNTHTPAVTSVSVNKEWDDNNNQDGKRPNNVAVQLYADNAASGEIVYLTSSNLWKYTWNGLPKYKDGVEIGYTVKEVTVPTGYEKTEVKNPDGSFTITNTYNTETVTVSGNKTWNDGNDQDGKRPESITIYLLADGAEVTSKTVTAADGWAWTFANLPKYKDGATIKYTVKEAAIPDYVQTVNGYYITNTYTPGKTSVTVNKQWDDENNQDGIRPASVSVQLYADGLAKGEAITLNEENQWTYIWSDLDLMSAGTAIEYTVDEVAVPAGYEKSITGDATTGFVIKNTHTPAVTNITVTKSWMDSNNQDGKRPASVTVQLYADGDPYGQAVTLNEANGWEYTWSGLPQKKSGTVVKYTVDELVVPAGYTKTISELSEGKVTITNRYTTEKVNISGSKTWVDENDKYDKRPESIKISLYRNNTLVSTKTVTAANNWAWSFTDLPKYENGVEIVYSIKEDAVESYTTEVNGYNVTNTYVKPSDPVEPTPTPTPVPGEPTPTPTPVPGSGSATPTPTPGSGSATPTPAPGSGSATPTPTPGSGSATPTPTPAGGSSTPTQPPTVTTPAPAPAPTPVPTPVPTPNPEVSVPKTADEAPIGIWVTFMMIGLSGMVAVAVCAKSRKNRRNQ